MWKSRDPLPTFETYLEHMSVLSEEKEKEVDQRIKETLDDAVRFAEDSPDPAPEEAVTDLYA
jgi:TPP-dependent pyruvate/acetoin dehydrogenase alpha subunit